MLIKAIPAIFDIVANLNIAINPKSKIAALIAPFSGTFMVFFYLKNSLRASDSGILRQYHYVALDDAKELFNDFESSKNLLLKRLWIFARKLADLT